MARASWISVSVVARRSEDFLMTRSPLCVKAQVLSSRGLLYRKLRQHCLQFGDHALHLGLRADRDTHAAQTIWPVTQRNATRAQRIQDCLLLVTKTAQNEVGLAGPAL